jgi:hypothetical protein
MEHLRRSLALLTGLLLAIGLAGCEDGWDTDAELVPQRKAVFGILGDSTNARLFRMDTSGLQLGYASALQAPADLVLAGGRLWVIDRARTALLALAPESGTVRARYELPCKPVALAAGRDQLCIGLADSSCRALQFRRLAEPDKTHTTDIDYRPAHIRYGSGRFYTGGGTYLEVWEAVAQARRRGFRTPQPVHQLALTRLKDLNVLMRDTAGTYFSGSLNASSLLFESREQPVNYRKRLSSTLFQQAYEQAFRGTLTLQEDSTLTISQDTAASLPADLPPVRNFALDQRTNSVIYQTEDQLVWWAMKAERRLAASAAGPARLQQAVFQYR